jgi:hypothetical protein
MTDQEGKLLQPSGNVQILWHGEWGQVRATNVQRFLQALDPRGLGVRLAGLRDIAELRHVRQELERAGVAAISGVTAGGSLPVVGQRRVIRGSLWPGRNKCSWCRLG